MCFLRGQVVDDAFAGVRPARATDLGELRVQQLFKPHTTAASTGMLELDLELLELLKEGTHEWWFWCGLTFELSGRRRQDARPGLAKMYRVPPDRAWWPAVGAPLERGVRPHSALALGGSSRGRRKLLRASVITLIAMAPSNHLFRS